MNQYDVVIRMAEPRYWVLLSVSFAAGWALLRRFKALDLDRKDRALKQVGWIPDCPSSGLSGVHVGCPWL